MKVAYKLLPQYTYNDYCLWEGKWELIDGIPYAMSPQPKPEHQRIAGSLHAELRSALKKSNGSCEVYQPVDYKISEDTVLNPDLCVLCRPPTKAYIDFPPELVVEILSPATVMKDRHTKFQLYQQEQIPYYLIIDVDEQSIEIYKLIEGKYEHQAVDVSVPYSFKLSGCSFEVVLNNIWN